MKIHPSFSLKFLLLLFIPFCLIWCRPAHACVGGECGYNARLSYDTAIDQGSALDTFDCCNVVSMIMLSPGNDTRTNLLMLMLDLHGVPPAVKTSSDDPPQFCFGVFRDALFPSPPDFSQNSYYDADYCLFKSAEDGFNAGIEGETGLPQSERNALIRLHRQMTQCSLAVEERRHRGDSQMDSTLFTTAEAQIHSKTGVEYLRYLVAAAAFYREDYKQAASDFAALGKADSAWVRETASYLRARIAVRASQSGAFDDYGNMKKDWRAGPAELAAANEALDAYISAYPKGLYVKSAQGLKRRVIWLSGDTSKLTADYVRAIAQDRTGRNVNDGELAQEIDNKLLFKRYDDFSGADTTDPILLAVIDLYRMRWPSEPNDKVINITREALLAQRPHFAKQKDLFDYLLAAHAFYVERKPDSALALIPEDVKQADFSYLQFSRQMLRGLAMQSGQSERAREHYVNMVAGAKRPFQRPALELAIALIDKNSKQVARIFAANSPVRNQGLRGVALSYFADAPLLRKQAQDANASVGERETAIFVLLYKELTRGFYADFLRDMALIPSDINTELSASSFYRFNPYLYPYTDGAPWRQPLGIFLDSIKKKKENSYACPKLKDAATTLAKNANDVRAKMCVAEFIRLNDGDMFMLDYDTEWDIKNDFNLFPGKPYSRLTVYRSVIADPKASPEDKAYALYRAVYCYGPSGYNACGGEEAEPAQRKAWFTQLKKKYPQSEWAKKLKYYW